MLFKFMQPSSFLNNPLRNLSLIILEPSLFWQILLCCMSESLTAFYQEPKPRLIWLTSLIFDLKSLASSDICLFEILITLISLSISYLGSLLTCLRGPPKFIFSISINYNNIYNIRLFTIIIKNKSHPKNNQSEDKLYPCVVIVLKNQNINCSVCINIHSVVPSAFKI